MNQQRFIINPDGTISDSKSDLMWQQATAEPMSQEDAISYCKDLTLGGYNNWRVPTIKELLTLIDYTRYNPAINIIAFPIGVKTWYWSSTPYAYGTGLTWCVNFNDGVNDYNLDDDKIYVRAVRGGKS